MFLFLCRSRNVQVTISLDDNDSDAETNVNKRKRERSPADSASRKSPEYKNRTFRCGHCQRKCASNTGLKSHERKCYRLSTVSVRVPKDNAANTKFFSCKLCDKKCGSNAGLKSHERLAHPDSYTGPGTPIEEKSFQCSICNRSFSQKPIYERHMKDHSEEEEKEKEECFECPMCSKKFQVISQLNWHFKYACTGMDTT